MSLPNDIARCHDEQCQVRERCERWVYRETGDPRTIHCTTLRPHWQVFTDPCDHAIGGFDDQTDS
jgi:hypothetical protein